MNNKCLFPTVLEAGSPRPACPTNSVSMRAHFLAHRWVREGPHIAEGGHCKESLRGPCREGPTPLSQPFPRGLTSNHHHPGVRFCCMNGGRSFSPQQEVSPALQFDRRVCVRLALSLVEFTSEALRDYGFSVRKFLTTNSIFKINIEQFKFI